jgi:hypothetical protein
MVGQILSNTNEMCYSNFSSTFHRVNTPIYSQFSYQQNDLGIGYFLVVLHTAVLDRIVVRPCIFLFSINPFWKQIHLIRGNKNIYI